MGEMIAFLLYFAVILGIGIYFMVKQKSGTAEYFLGGRSMGSWVTALSAQASDMSGWLLMGLPGSIFAFGLGKTWIAIGLVLGTYLNWLFVAGRLRRFTKFADDSITIPSYLQNRFKTKNMTLRVVSAVVFTVCFTVYAASALKAGGQLFQTVFGIDYSLALLIGTLIIVIYTLTGGFKAVCWTDFFQGMMMLAAILITPIAALCVMNGLPAGTISPEMLNIIPGGQFTVQALVEILSGLAWGLGYLGMPHILVRFMAIKSSSMIKKSRRIACVWVVFALIGAVMVGFVGIAFLPDLQNGELVFIEMVRKLFPGFIAGILLSAIMAASMSTADSQLLVAASAVTEDVYHPLIRKKASDKELGWISRGVVVAVSLIAFLIALNPGSGNIMSLVENAWAGFGASFGPVILLSLYWRRITYRGAIAGILAGAATVILWINFFKAMTFGLYELLPGFLVGLAVVVVVSLLDKAPPKEVIELFDMAVDRTIDDE